MIAGLFYLTIVPLAQEHNDITHKCGHFLHKPSCCCCTLDQKLLRFSGSMILTRAQCP